MFTSKSLSFPLEMKFIVNKFSIFFSIFIVVALTQISGLHFIQNDNDCGYFLSNQNLANHLGFQYIKIVPWWWFSDIVGAWWLKLSENYGVWGAKLGAAIGIGLAGAITAKAMFQIYKPSLTVCLAMAFMGLCRQDEMLDYISVPTLLYALFTYCFIKMNTNPSNNFYPVASGISFVFLVFSRMPMILGIVIPVACLLFCYRMIPDRRSLFLRSYLKMYIAIFGCFLAFTFLLYANGLLANYFVPSSHSKDHTLLALLNLYANELMEKIPAMLIISVVTYAFFYFIKNGWLSNRYADFTFIALLISNLVFGALGFMYPDIKELAKQIWPDRFDIYPILISMNIVCLCLLKGRYCFQEVVLVILGVAWPFLRTVGSANGIHWGCVMTGFLLCGISIVLLNRVATLYHCKTALFCFAAILIWIAGGMSINSRMQLAKKPYIKTTQIAQMDGIYIAPAYADHLGSLLREMRKYAKKGDNILAYPYIPIVHYTSETLPLGNHSCLFFLDITQFREKLDQISVMKPPKLIVRPKISFQNPKIQEERFGWPIRAEWLSDLENKYAILDQKLLKKWNAKLVWSNDWFELLLPNTD